MDLARTIREQLLPTLIAVILTVTYAYLLIVGTLDPRGLEVLVAAVVAFYFGAATGSTARRNGVSDTLAQLHPNVLAVPSAPPAEPPAPPPARTGPHP